MVQRVARKNEESFERNWRRKFERRMRPVADNLYREIIPGIKDIDRRYRMRLPLPIHVELGVLDKELGIDVIFTLNNGMQLTCQEKFGSPSFTHLKDVTVEYYNEPTRGVPGDWFKLISQLYFFGFASKDYRHFDLWVLLDWPKTVWATIKGNITWERKTNTKNGAMADFMRMFMANLPESCILQASFKESL
ncbi:hypothetical protein ES703_15517 [subsurface metagenome]